MELTRYLLQVHFVLSERFNQDPLENFFGMQRSSCGRCDNPTVQQFVKNAVFIRVQKSAAVAPFRGNCRQRRTREVLVDSTPIPKRQRLRSMPN